MERQYPGFFHWFLGSAAGLSAAGIYYTFTTATTLNVSTASVKWMLLFAAEGVVFLAFATVFILSLTKNKDKVFSFFEHWGTRITGIRPISISLFTALALVFPALSITPLTGALNILLSMYGSRSVIFWGLTFAGAIFLHGKRSWHMLPVSIAKASLIYAVAYRVGLFLPDISTSPFSLSWSEASRFYYASLFFSESIYGQSVNPTVLHPTRYMLQSLPFFISGLPLWVHRAWQVLLWISTNTAAALIFSKRVTQSKSKIFWFAGMWAFLFLFQGPVWYHLVVMIILVFWGYDRDRFWKTTIFVLLASFWGGISRINWIPFPAALAGILYLVETPRGGTPLWRYLTPLALWGGGGLVAGFAAQTGYAILSGNSLDQFSSSLTSDLLWYRLLPSSTFPIGILFGILLVTLPVAWVIAAKLRGQWKRVAPIRWLGIFGILFLFFAGGIVVSVKIGGGSNLHNLDGYLTLLLAFGGWVYFDRLRCDKAQRDRSSRDIPWQAFALSIFIPAAFALSFRPLSPLEQTAQIEEKLQNMIGQIERAADSGEEVLFIAERQLLTFGMVEGAALVDDYEKVFLMEMSMAGNPDYLGQFAEDLENHRFAFIVSDTANFNPQTRADEFGEENNVWDTHVTYPLLCNYQELITIKGPNVQLLSPRDEVSCP